MNIQNAQIVRKVVLLGLFIVISLGLVANWFVGRMSQTVAHFKQEIMNDQERLAAEMRESLKQMEAQYQAFEAKATHEREKRNEERRQIHSTLEAHQDHMFQEAAKHFGLEK